MDSPHADPLVNRDDPIPVLSVSAPSDRVSPLPSRSRSKREALRRSLSSDRLEALKHSLSTDKLKEKLDGFAGHYHQRDPKSESPTNLQDRLMNMLLQQIIPAEELDDNSKPKDRRSRKYVERPNFSLPTMSTNFRRFNARIGVAFVFQNRLIRLFSWKDPTHTFAFLAMYSFVCIDPNLLAVIPLAGCLFFIMVPAFLARHPPPPAHVPTDTHSLQGPPTAPPQNIKPAPELSKDFLRNMRDLQNSMEDFSRLHDATISAVAPPTNFSNEALSSSIYLLLLLTSCALFIVAQILPWRAVFLVGGWVLVCAGHPRAQSFLESTHADAILQEQSEHASSWLSMFASADIDLSNAPERREVEVFELQRRASSADDAEYEPFLFTTSPYTPLSPARIAGDRPRGTRFFEDVEPPRGWGWADKKWTLDLLSREWVEERCVTGVEIEIEGERWVSDIRYDDEIVASLSAEEPAKAVAAVGVALASGASGDNVKGRRATKSWEEGNGSGEKGAVAAEEVGSAGGEETFASG